MSIPKHRLKALKARAYEEAAALLDNEMSAIDLPSDLSPTEEEFMREFIRITICGQLATEARNIRNIRL